MCTYNIHFSARRYVALIASVKIRMGRPSLKTARNEQVVHTKSPTGSKFSNFEQLHTGWIVVVHLYFTFSLWRQMAPQQRQI